PFAGLVAKAEHRVRIASLLDSPLAEPPLAVKRARVPRHVGRKPHLSPAEGETAALDAVDERHQREARRLERILAVPVAGAQYARRAMLVGPVEAANRSADGRVYR